ncbi:enoyl-CoA hydratase/isomerase family protein [Psychrobacter sp. I-STPA6b]|uniref:enoyl-CoA hydratase/isomerase family protein n=1 Tax=Psychrobacter sp. I-STPA6b TaxID=2585718 RepID=UPI001D0C3BF2|nr:enoyl-CoA hydratase/isomerase family protein [Psychrobacter sp. I-STPA6b]
MSNQKNSQKNSYQGFNTLLVTIDNQVATVTLNRPDKRNAFNDEVIAELQQVFSQLGTDTQVRAIVLTGAGKAFCAGADLNWMRAMADYDRSENLADADKLAQMLSTIYHCPKPTVAAIQGDVYAGGVGLVAVCDVAIAVKTASFCLSEVRLGLVPATISPYVVQAMGVRAARRYFLTAEVFDAKEARRIGLIHERVSEEELQDVVADISQRLCKVSPNALSVCKKLLDDVAYQDIDESLIQYTVEGIADIRASDEGKEGVQAFLQKRKPNWLG